MANDHTLDTAPATSPSAIPDGYDESLLPDFTTDFLPAAHLAAFVAALSAPEPSQSPSTEDLASTLTLNAASSPPSVSRTTTRSRSRSRSESVSASTRRRRRGESEDVYGHSGHNAAGRRAARSPGQSANAFFGNGNATASQSSLFITAQNDWAPVGPPQSLLSSNSGGLGGRTGEGRVSGAPSIASRKSGKAKRRKTGKRPPRRSRDETREGYFYTILQWPLLILVGGWIMGLGATYLVTRLYVWAYEHFVAWRGKREALRRQLRSAKTHGAWVAAAKEMDRWSGGDAWRKEDGYAYYDSRTVRRVLDQLKRIRSKIQKHGYGLRRKSSRTGSISNGANPTDKAVAELRTLIEACVKNNFVGVENPRLYSQTYYGTKDLVQEFVDEVEKCIELLAQSEQIGMEEKRNLFRRMRANNGRTALCLSGGASFAYYHFGVIKALLDADLLPEVITGTSGGALVAAMVATRTNDELKALLVPALAGKINACSETFMVWFPRWWKTGARFDSADWAQRCSWFSRGSMTFREAYQRTGRILNVSCVPADPHSPTILTNYLTSPDCVIWSAVLASAAVPGIQNPVVLMMKEKDGSLSPYSFGHKWKDGSLRTDIPIRALNLHFNVNFSIVSQVNPHINLFFFSSRGSVGQPVTHRRGRGWRGGFLGSAAEQYLKLDLNKWLKVMRHLELLPRPLGQDWSEIWLQQFSGTITIWPKSVASDFWRILSDPKPKQLGRMLDVGQQSAFPKLKFLSNRMKVERAIEAGWRATRGLGRSSSVESLLDGTAELDESDDGLGTETGTATTDYVSDDDGATTADDFDDAVSVLEPLLD